MEPSDGDSNTNHGHVKQDHGKFEEELPSFSRFFPYCEVKESTELNAAELFATGQAISEEHTQEHSMSYETAFRSEIFDTNLKDDAKVSEDRARQLAAVKKRARQWKDQSKNGKEIYLDMKDKNLERIVAAIVDVCELKVNVGGQATLNASAEDDNKQMGVGSIDEFVEKAEQAAMLMKRDSNAHTTNVDKVETEKMRNSERSSSTFSGTKTKLTTEQLAGMLSDINAEISNEKERNKEVLRRNLKSQSCSDTDKDETNVQAKDQQASGSEELSRNEKKITKTPRWCRFSPYQKLPPISDLKTEQSTPKPQGKQLDSSKKTEQLTTSNTTNLQARGRGTEASTSKTADNSDNRCQTQPLSKEDAHKPHFDQRSIPSSMQLLSPTPPTKDLERYYQRMRYKKRRNETPFMVSSRCNWPTKSYVMTEAGTKHKTMSGELIGLKRPDNVPIYVRRYRTHRRSRNVKLHPVSPTTGTAYIATLPNYVENTSPRTTPSPSPSP